jgi:hypothetical protein
MRPSASSTSAYLRKRRVERTTVRGFVGFASNPAGAQGVSVLSV